MPDSTYYPKYSELPFNETLKCRYAWGVFGEDDQLGRVNLLTPQVVAEAAKEIQSGVSFRLCLPLDLPEPWHTRGRYEHNIWKTKRGQDDYLDKFYLQASTQWDALKHYRAREFGYWNGITDEAEDDGDKLGIENWAEHGIIGRGVLADVARWAEAEGRPISPREEYYITVSDLESTLARENVTLRDGDILLVRTGYLETYLAASEEERGTIMEERSQPGLRAGGEVAEFLWDNGVAAVAADNLAVEATPGSREVGSLHRELIPLLGFAYGEYFNLGPLAEASAADGRYTSFFSSAPLYLPRGVGSPPNAFAIK